MDDLLVEREQHNQKKAQLMTSPLCSAQGAFFEVPMLRLIYLSDEFYSRYGHYEEVLKKDGRPYACLAVEIDGYRFAIPFRHHIAHKYAFLTYDRCGLDYTKAVAIENDIMISPEIPTIEQREYNALKGKDPVITAGMRRYYRTLRNAMQHPDNPNYANILRFSALKYFL